MNLSLLLQYGVIGLAVLISVYVVLKKQFPGSVRRVRIALAIFLSRESRPKWLRHIGKRLAPEPKPRPDACGGCPGCDSGPD